MNEMISGDESQSTHMSEATITLSSPSQKLWLSSQESVSPAPSDTVTVLCEDINAPVTIDGDTVVLPKAKFDYLVSQASSFCDLKTEVERLRNFCTDKFGKRGTPVTDPIEFRQLCSDAGAVKIFDFILNAMETDRQSNKRKDTNELRTVSVIYTLMYGQSQQANWFQVATARTLRGLGVSDRGVAALRRMELAAHPYTVTNVSKEMSLGHLNTVQKVLNDAKANEKLVTLFIDDHHNIHTHHRPSSDTQTQVVHMATLLIKVFDVNAIPVADAPVNDPVPANITFLKSLLSNKMEKLSKTYVSDMPDWLHTKVFDTESQRHRLLIHDYEQQEMRELRSMDGCKLVDCIELSLKSYADFLTAMNVILASGLSEYLEAFVVPFLGDWPAQFYVRQMVYNVENHLDNIISFLGPLHISLNARENVVLKFHGVFADLYSFLFHGKKPLAKKPKPWRISFLLEVLYGGWSIVRDEILGVFAHCKDVEFLTLVNLDNYIPLVLSIYSVIFKNQMVDLHYDSMLRCWLMFLLFRRRHYDKALLIALSNIGYLKSIDHPYNPDPLLISLCL